MAEQKHPEAGRLRIRNGDGRTDYTVVEMADGAGGWTKVRGVTALSWEGPGSGTFTKAVLHIEAPLMEAEVRPEAVDLQVAHRGGVLTMEDIGEVLKTTWEELRLPQPTTLVPTDMVDAMAYATTSGPRHTPAPLQADPTVPLPAVRHTALFDVDGKKSRFELDVPSRHVQRRLEMLVAATRGRPEDNPRGVEELIFEDTRFPLPPLPPKNPGRLIDLVLELPKLAENDAPFVRFLAKDPDRGKRAVDTLIERAMAPQGRGEIRVGYPEDGLEPPDFSLQTSRGRMVDVVLYGDETIPRRKVDRISIASFPRCPVDRRWLVNLLRMCADRETQVIRASGDWRLREGDEIPLEPSPATPEMVAALHEGAAEKPPLRVKELVIASSPAVAYTPPLGFFGHTKRVTYGAALGGLQVESIRLLDDPPTQKDAEWVSIVAMQRLLPGGAVRGPDGMVIDAASHLLPASWGFGAVRASELAVDSIPTSALRADAEVVDPATIGFGPPDPTPEPETPARPSKAFNEALAAALRKHREL